MKPKEINELVNELKDYNEEMTVKVWSNGTNKAYPISHVGQGHTDGELDTYVSIVDDDRNLVDLSKIWHDASEQPQNYPILCQDEWSNVWVQYTLTDYADGWKEFEAVECLTRWAYVSDLLPKGGWK